MGLKSYKVSRNIQVFQECIDFILFSLGFLLCFINIGQIYSTNCSISSDCRENQFAAFY